MTTSDLTGYLCEYETGLAEEDSNDMLLEFIDYIESGSLSDLTIVA